MLCLPAWGLNPAAALFHGSGCALPNFIKMLPFKFRFSCGRGVFLCGGLIRFFRFFFFLFFSNGLSPTPLLFFPFSNHHSLYLTINPPFLRFLSPTNPRLVFTAEYRLSPSEHHPCICLRGALGGPLRGLATTECYASTTGFLPLANCTTFLLSRPSHDSMTSYWRLTSKPLLLEQRTATQRRDLHKTPTRLTLAPSHARKTTTLPQNDPPLPKFPTKCISRQVFSQMYSRAGGNQRRASDFLFPPLLHARSIKKQTLFYRTAFTVPRAQKSRFGRTSKRVRSLLNSDWFIFPIRAFPILTLCLQIAGLMLKSRHHASSGPCVIARTRVEKIV